MQHNIYLEVDSFLDTRIGTIAVLGYRNNTKPHIEIFKAFDKKNNKNNLYFYRLADYFTNITKGLVKTSEYEELYKNRGNDPDIFLASVMMTNIFKILDIELAQMLVNLKRKFKVNEINVVLNVYPYKLSAEQKKDIELNLRSRIPHPDIKIHITDLAYKDMTFEYITQTFCTMYLYNFDEWFQYHHDKIETAKPSRNTTRLCIPKICFVPKTFENMLAQKDINIPEIIEGQLTDAGFILSMQTNVFLELHPVIMFSMESPMLFRK